ncbi:MAG: sulfotransferase, partial [Kordiimonadaceae bacterium]|nr:sulfotransferase [Kordiimonadaceae bacterium]
RAIPFFQKAITLDPHPANFHYNLGSSLQFSGRFEEAAEAYQGAISREPNFYKAYSGLIALSKQTNDTSKLEKLTALFEENQEDADATLHLGHAIAKTHEDLGEHDQSLHWLTRAKAMNAIKFAVDMPEQNALFEAAKSTFNAKGAKDTGFDTSAPIFVVGLPRTGTTLVDRILSSHPEVTAAGETNVFAGLVKVATQTTDNMVLDSKTLLAATSVNMAPIGRHYVANTKALARGAPRFTDKMPLNFFYAGLIHQALPNARIIVLRRGAMDSCISNYRQLFSTQYSYYNYTYDLESIGHFYRGFDNLIDHWKATLPANRFMEVHYEDIVFDQENQTRKLLEFCDLSWNEACLRFHENDTPVSTASSVQVRQPLYAGSIGRWKKYSAGLDPLKKALGDLADPSSNS